MDLVRGAVDPRGGYVSKILHVKMKESGPVGGGGAPPLDPPMTWKFSDAKEMNNVICKKCSILHHMMKKQICITMKTCTMPSKYLSSALYFI